MKLKGELHTPVVTTSFAIHSLDVWLCPANIGMIAIRVELKGKREVSEAINFAHFFRVLEPQLEEEMGAAITVDGEMYDTSYLLIKEHLLPFFERYLVEYKEVVQYGECTLH